MDNQLYGGMNIHSGIHVDWANWFKSTEMWDYFQNSSTIFAYSQYGQYYGDEQGCWPSLGRSKCYSSHIPVIQLLFAMDQTMNDDANAASSQLVTIQIENSIR